MAILDYIKIVNISDYLDINLVSFLSSKSRDEAISIMVKNLDNFEKLFDKKLFYDSIIKRENIVSTGIGMSVAIPHAKNDKFSKFFIAIGVQKENGIEWNSLDDSPVKLIFMIGGPEKKQNEYLKILSSLTVIIKDENLRKKLINSTSKEAVINLLSEF